MSNPAQNRGSCPVIVELSEFKRGRLAHAAKVNSNGTVSSFSPPASGLGTGIPWNVAGDTKTADPRGSITEDVPILRIDHAPSQATLSGVREGARPRFP